MRVVFPMGGVSSTFVAQTALSSMLGVRVDAIIAVLVVRGDAREDHIGFRQFIERHGAEALVLSDEQYTRMRGVLYPYLVRKEGEKQLLVFIQRRMPWRYMQISAEYSHTSEW